MQPDVLIKSIEFKVGGKNWLAISSVRVNLSNGESSPIFEKSDHTHYDPLTVNFDANTRIRTIEAGGDDRYGGWAGAIKFMDSSGEVVYVYDPNVGTEPTTTYQIGENEELIGVYG